MNVYKSFGPNLFYPSEQIETADHPALALNKSLQEIVSSDWM